MTRAKATLKKTARSLLEYMRAKRLADQCAKCAVCRLPDAVKTAIREERDKETKTKDIRDWLREEHSIEVSDLDFRRHGSAAHDARLEALRG